MSKASSIVIKKVSLCSLDNYALSKGKSKEENTEDVAPRDNFYFVTALFLLLGLMHFVPYSFFVTANAYWMYKFRNTSADITDTSARTVLQTHFSPANSITNVLLTPFTMYVAAFYGYKIKARLRVLVALSVISACFAAGTAFVKINTDSWQLLFFIVTVVILAIISVANTAISTANLTILSRFPPYFMKVYLTGEGMGGICSALLQISSLALGSSTEVSALLYFVSGSVLMMMTLILFYFSKYNDLYNYHMNSSVEDISKDVISLSEGKALARKIWAQIVTFILILLTLAPIAPNITSLVVSENYGSGNQWSDKYFVPVITFLFADIIGLMGRTLSAKVTKTFDGVPLCVFMFLRMMVFVPLIYFCNAQPRHYLPVLFHHDWQYTIILAAFNFSTGYLMNMVYFDITNLVGPEKVEDAYMVMLACVTTSMFITSPIGMFSVDLL